MSVRRREDLQGFGGRAQEEDGCRFEHFAQGGLLLNGPHMAKVNCVEDKYLSKGGTCCDRCPAGRLENTNFPFLCFFFHSYIKPDCDTVNPFKFTRLLCSSTTSFLHLLSRLSSGAYVRADCDGRKATQCESCGRGFYTATKNYLNKCQKCTQCSPSKSDHVLRSSLPGRGACLCGVIYLYSICGGKKGN